MTIRRNKNKTTDFRASSLINSGSGLLGALFVAAAVFFSMPAFAEFNSYDVLGPGAVSSSIGGLSVGASSDQLEYLSNPSLIGQFEATRYTLSLSRGVSSGEVFGNEYSSYILSYASDKKAYTLSIDNENDWSRDMLTYTAYFPYGAREYDLGVNISGFRYSKPLQFSTDLGNVAFPEDQGSGFSLSVGASKELPNKIKAGASIQNLIGYGSAVKTPHRTSGESIFLPRIINLSISYPYKDRYRFYAGYKIMEVTHETGSSQSGGMMYVGAELELADKSKSGRMGFSSNNVFTSHADKEILYGASISMNNYMAAGYAAQKNDVSDNMIGLTVSYKPDEKLPWKGAPPAPEPTIVDIPLKSESDKGKFEAPLPPVKTEPEEKAEPVEEKSPVKTEKSSKSVPVVEKTRTKVASFDVAPKVMMMPSRKKSGMRIAEGHWAEPYYKSLAEDGFYPSDPDGSYKLNGLVNRAEYYRLLFVSQISELFIDPVSVTFNTPYAVGAELWLDSPLLEAPVLLQEGTYERAGMKRLVVNSELLQEKEILPGKYKLTLKLTAQNMLTEELEDYITIIDTSVDFTAIISQDPATRRQRVEAFKDSMKQLGIKVDYLDGLISDDPITRMEAIRVMLQSSSVDLPSEFNKEEMLFSDVWQLDAADQSVVFLASRGMGSLGGQPLMSGFGDGKFQPAKEMTNAEGAALVDRYRKLSVNDFEPPYRVAAAPEIRKPDRTATSQKKPETSEAGLVPLPLPGETPEEPASRGRVKYLAVAGSFMDETNAKRAVELLKENGQEPDFIVEKIGVIEVYHVVMAKFDNRGDAEKYLEGLAPIAGLDYKITTFMSGDETAYTGSVGGRQGNHSKPQYKRDRKDAEGTLRMDGDSFLPWNLIRNLNDFSPQPVEIGGYIVE